MSRNQEELIGQIAEAADKLLTETARYRAAAEAAEKAGIACQQAKQRLEALIDAYSTRTRSRGEEA